MNAGPRSSNNIWRKTMSRPEVKDPKSSRSHHPETWLPTLDSWLSPLSPFFEPLVIACRARRILDRRRSVSVRVGRARNFQRLRRTSKKLERSTRVCRLRRPCASDRSGQCHGVSLTSSSSAWQRVPCTYPVAKGGAAKRGTNDTDGIRGGSFARHNV